MRVWFPCFYHDYQLLGLVLWYKPSRRHVGTYFEYGHAYYSNSTTWVNKYGANDEIPDHNDQLNKVTLNCSWLRGCSSSEDQWGFNTYPLRPGVSLDALLEQTNLSHDVSVHYAPVVGEVDMSRWGASESSDKGISAKIIGGICLGAVAGLVLLAAALYFGYYRKKKLKRPSASKLQLPQSRNAHRRKAKRYKDIIVDTSVKFSYEELAQATNSFSKAHKIGEGGFGAVYYAELRGKKAAIKKMGLQASKEFLAELKVLANVHHLNLVHLIGYCIEGSLFLVYEYTEKGNLGQHLLGSGNRDPLPWSTRVQIALDSARGLEYVHEHTVPVCIHRDIKSANILIDRNFRGKVADFGLAKLASKAGSTGLIPSGLVGTFGYMAPEYARGGQASPKADVYAFGVVLYELISAKPAVVETNDPELQARGLVALFENVLNQTDPREDLCKLIDSRLGDNYPLDSVLKMAQLGKACTEENPKLRPDMRSIVVTLTTLSSSDDSFIENQAQCHIVSVQ